jgi:hypothetical protein
LCPGRGRITAGGFQQQLRRPGMLAAARACGTVSARMSLFTPPTRLAVRYGILQPSLFRCCLPFYGGSARRAYARSPAWRESARSWMRIAVAGGVGSALVLGGLSSYVAQCKGRVQFEQLPQSGAFGEERFEVKSKLGEGGQAEVFKALDKKTRKLVAIKVTRKSLPEGKHLVISLPPPCCPACQAVMTTRAGAPALPAKAAAHGRFGAAAACSASVAYTACRFSSDDGRHAGREM